VFLEVQESGFLACSLAALYAAKAIRWPTVGGCCISRTEGRVWISHSILGFMGVKDCDNKS
jgi:hypothetical protein